MQQIWNSADAQLYLFAIGISTLAFGIVDPQHNPAQVLIVAGLILFAAGVHILLIARRSRNRLICRIIRNLILPGVVIALSGILLFRVGICEAPFWAR